MARTLQAALCTPAGAMARTGKTVGTDMNFRHSTVFAAGLAVIALLGAAALHAVNSPVRSTEVKKSIEAPAVPPPAIGQGRDALPTAVQEMHDAILAAARSGSLEELLIPIQWNELPPDFGERSVKETLADWKKNSPAGSGREWLALLANLLEAPYAMVHRGRDIENAKIFIWPAFAELPLDKLTPALEVELLRLVPPDEFARMKAAGGYDGYGLVIGADGTWHAFKKVKQPHKEVK
ncbi:MAG: hypothetical protein KKB37_06725 [Alphaproteobacteria bacterium]|nr:hypothetical protein [Alphaproteobacteria bacterium]